MAFVTKFLEIAETSNESKKNSFNGGNVLYFINKHINA